MLSYVMSSQQYLALLSAFSPLFSQAKSGGRRETEVGKTVERSSLLHKASMKKQHCSDLVATLITKRGDWTV